MAGSLLERVVLGIVWKSGPLTPYAIRREFALSPTAHFSGSTGAIYPLVDRLERRGWLRSRSDARGKRPRRLVEVTRSGIAELRDWLRSEPSDEDLSVPFDPLRTRIYFIAALTEAERDAYLLRVESAFIERARTLREQRQDYESAGERASELATDGAVRLAQARLSWIRHVRRRLAEIPRRELEGPSSGRRKRGRSSTRDRRQ